MKLSDCLSTNTSVLGNHCKNLGKPRESFFSGKTLLSYTHQDGWEVLELNVIQLFFRKFLGAYKSTHLNHILKKINKLEITNDIKDCHNRIETLWIKKNIHLWINENLIGLGNSDLDKANVICFAEEHGDKHYRIGMAQLINAAYKENDIVLVEGIEADEVILPKDLQQTRWLKPECIVRGWEPKDFEKDNGASFQKASKAYEKLKSAGSYFIENLKQQGNFTSEEIAILEPELEKLKKEISDLNEYYGSTSNAVVNSAKHLNENFKKLKEGTLSLEGNHGAIFIWIILKIKRELEKNQEEALHANMTPSEVEEIMKAVSKRNTSLINQINKYREEGRRVFVISGASHFVQFPTFESCEEVKKCLHGSPFVVITRKKFFTEKIAELNQDLKPFDINGG